MYWGFLIGVILGTTMIILFPSEEKPTYIHSDVKEAGVETDNVEVAIPNAAKEPEELSIAAIAERDLYRIFYDKDMLDHPSDFARYSDAMRQTFKTHAIDDDIKQPYSKSLNALFEEIGRLEQESCSLIIDSDLLWGGQGDIGNFNIEVLSIEERNPDCVLIKTKFTNLDTYGKDFLLVRENGAFRIDDMLSHGVSLKKSLAEDIASTKKYIEEEKKREETSSVENIEPNVMEQPDSISQGSDHGSFI